jgi:uncharacterized protein YprB with RNaseH-like and TPR domain
LNKQDKRRITIMNLKEKLAKLDRATSSFSSASPDFEISAVAALLPGEEFPTEFGPCWRNRISYDMASLHGRYRIGDILDVDAAPLVYVAKNADYGNIRLENLLFIDTEATGLSGGVGTVAFLIGIGFVEDERFVIEQFFMREFSEESAALQSFMAHFERARGRNGAIVSFNGKSFDLPLLANRAVIHRLDWPDPNFANIDVLHPARRLWKESYEECTLAALESRVLGVEREGDVPGYLIPELYFRYLRTGDPRPLGPVFYHNQMDILSLVGLLNEMIKLYQGEAENLSDNVDWLRMGRAYDDMRAYDDGLKFYQDLLSQDLPPGKRTGVLLRIAAIHKKNRQYDEAVPFWQEVLQQDGFCLEAYEELAKAYEHRIIDLEKAKNYTESALENLGVIDELCPNPYFEKTRQELLWRLKRLERKTGKGV